MVVIILRICNVILVEDQYSPTDNNAIVVGIFGYRRYSASCCGNASVFPPTDGKHMTNLQFSCVEFMSELLWMLVLSYH